MARLEAVFAATLGLLLPVLLVCLTALSIAQVALRYGGFGALVWAEQASIVLMIALAWAGVSLLWLRDEHIAIDLLPDALTPGPRRALLAAIDLLAAFLALGLAIAAEATVAVYWDLDIAALGLPAAVKYLPVQIGAAVLACAALLRLARRLRGQP